MGRLKTVELTVTGRVQGVSYRWAVQALARKSGISGFARNNSDGSVTVVAQGQVKKIDEFIRQCYHASKGADVAGIKTQTLPPHREF